MNYFLKKAVELLNNEGLLLDLTSFELMGNNVVEIEYNNSMQVLHFNTIDELANIICSNS